VGGAEQEIEKLAFASSAATSKSSCIGEYKEMSQWYEQNAGSHTEGTKKGDGASRQRQCIPTLRPIFNTVC